MNAKLLVFAVFLILTMTLTACSGAIRSQSMVPGAIDQARIRIFLWDGTYSPSAVSFKNSQEVVLTLVNTGLYPQSWILTGNPALSPHNDAGMRHIYASAKVAGLGAQTILFTAPDKSQSLVSTCPVTELASFC